MDTSKTAALRQRLGGEAPGVLWARGDLSLLNTPAVALVGSRDLRPPNEAFAKEVGEQAARQGFVLISGNARGADRTAQDSCLAAGGQVISVVADALSEKTEQENVLYLSEEDYDQAFSAQRALRRNRVIHALGEVTLVAQSDLGIGGTWSGTTTTVNNAFNNNARVSYMNATTLTAGSDFKLGSLWVYWTWIKDQNGIDRHVLASANDGRS